MKRRPLLYVINFLLPIVFFLTLDLASFFIADHRGEKLGFKVTVLLAISVLLLILNDILPSMSNKTPLIGTRRLSRGAVPGCFQTATQSRLYRSLSSLQPPTV